VWPRLPAHEHAGSQIGWPQQVGTETKQTPRIQTPRVQGGAGKKKCVLGGKSSRLLYLILPPGSVRSQQGSERSQQGSVRNQQGSVHSQYTVSTPQGVYFRITRRPDDLLTHPDDLSLTTGRRSWFWSWCRCRHVECAHIWRRKGKRGRKM
jgi:hypothetical protein